MSNVTILPIAMIRSLPMDARAVYSCLVQAACKDKGEIDLGTLAAELAISRERLDECLAELVVMDLLAEIAHEWSQVSSIELGSVTVTAEVAQLVLGPTGDEPLRLKIEDAGGNEVFVRWDRHWNEDADGDYLDRLIFSQDEDFDVGSETFAGEIELINSSRCLDWPEGVADVARDVYEHVVRNREPVHANGEAKAPEPAKAGKR